MAQMQRVSKNNTTIRNEGLDTVVTLHQTEVVRFNKEKIILDSGGWDTVTTKTRMNQVSNEFGLGYSVSQMNFKWYVCFKGESFDFYDGIELTR
jgi:hypothetical protein